MGNACVCLFQRLLRTSFFLRAAMVASRISSSSMSAAAGASWASRVREAERT
jgi:hypothetical protein